MSHFIKLVVGDWSDDGHGKTDEYTYMCSHSAEDVQEAYNRAVEIVGVDMVEDVACDYEEPYISADQAKLIHRHLPCYFKNNGPWEVTDEPYKKYVGGVWEEVKGLYVDDDRFLDLYLSFIKLGNPEITLTKIERQEDRINIGGYALFS